MKRILYFLLILLLASSCAVKKKPIFLKVDDVKFLSLKTDTIRLGANAYFKNPNNIGGKISTNKIKVIVNGAELAQVSSKEFKVPAKQDFVIPLRVVIPAKKVFENNKAGILGGLINSVLNKTLKIRFKGELNYKVLGYSNVYIIDSTKDIKIKL